MAIYRTVSMTFWTDRKVTDDFTAEDKYFYLYLFTNPHTNLSGCYEISLKQIANETGYSKDSIENLIRRFEFVHNVVRFSDETKEILLLNWHKYNWTNSEKFRKPLLREIENIKCDLFRDYLKKIYNGDHSGYGIDTTCINTNCSDTSVTVTDTDTVSDSVTDTDTVNKRNKYKDLLNKLLLEVNISDYLLEAVNNWIGYKEERNFKYKERGLQTLLKTISDKSSQFGDEAVTNVINESISNGYQGIVWDKLKNGNKKSSWKKDSREEQFDNLMEQIRRDAKNDN